MRVIRRIVWGLFAAAALLIVANARAQVVINELVDDERSAGSGQIADTREFLELYNSGATAVDISNWTINAINIGTTPGLAASYTIPASSSIASHGFYVVGAAG